MFLIKIILNKLKIKKVKNDIKLKILFLNYNYKILNKLIVFFLK